MIAKLPGSGIYDSFAYEVALLKDFLRDDNDTAGQLSASMGTGRGRKKRHGSGLNSSHNPGLSLRNSFRGGSLFGRKPKSDGLDGSIHSQGSLRGRSNVKRNGSVGR